MLLTLAIPVGLLVFFSLVDVLPRPDGVDEPVDFLAPGHPRPGRHVGGHGGPGHRHRLRAVLRGAEAAGVDPPRPARRCSTAKTLAILAVEAVQVVVLVAVAVALGWRPDGNWLLALAAVLLATVGFAGLGLLLAGTLPALTTLAAANGLYLVLLLLGGMVFPLDRLPGPLRAVAQLLPAAALSEALGGALGVARRGAGPALAGAAGVGRRRARSSPPGPSAGSRRPRSYDEGRSDSRGAGGAVSSACSTCCQVRTSPSSPRGHGGPAVERRARGAVVLRRPWWRTGRTAR